MNADERTPVSERQWRFSKDYEEEIELAAGVRATLRLLRPDDKEALVEGFRHVSPRSRYRRFFTGKPRLTDAELRYFTEIDGVNHFAIGALVQRETGRPEPAAVGRFVRLAGEDHAEFAITVVDDFQHLGLGSILFERLMSAARERGIAELQGEVLAENLTMLDLLREAAPEATLHHDAAIVHCRIPVT